MKTKAMKTKEEVRQKVINYLKTNPQKVYWDYRDQISVEQAQKIISTEDGYNDFADEVFEINIDYINDLEDYTLKNALSELNEEEVCLLSGEDWNEDTDDLVSELRDEFLDYLEVDLNIDQLIRNSPNFVFFYSAGVELNGDYKEDVRTIKRFLKILMRDTTHDQAIMEAVGNAGYGGTLCFAFSCELEEWMWMNEKPTTITFRNPYIVIPNHSNGSGWHSQMKGFEITLPFRKENLYLDEAIKYSYTKDVCGMSSDWCADTDFQIGYNKISKQIKKSRISEHMEREMKYDETYKNGGCTPGDMNINRHRDVYYRNEFPCGNKCPHCGTFWID